MALLSGVAIELVFVIPVVDFLDQHHHDKDDDDNDEDSDDGNSNLDHSGGGGKDGDLKTDFLSMHNDVGG